MSRGEVETNRKKAREFGLTFPVGLQRHWGVSRLYAMFATPIGCLIDERGIIAADLAIGVTEEERGVDVAVRPFPGELADAKEERHVCKPI